MKLRHKKVVAWVVLAPFLVFLSPLALVIAVVLLVDWATATAFTKEPSP
jgi:hypothetical protein